VKETHTFCDCCGEEIKGTARNWAGVELTKWFRPCVTELGQNVTVEVKVTLPSGPADYSLDICSYCVIDFLRSFDDRPTESSLT